MTAEFVTPSGSAHFALPGKPVPYFLEAGEGERSHLFDQLFTVLLSGDETDGQFGVFTMEAPRGEAVPVHSHVGVHEIFFVLDGRIRVVVEDGGGEDRDGERLDRVLGPGDFGYVPAGRLHTFRVESHRAKALGVNTGGFERFFSAAGERTDSYVPPVPPVVPPAEQLGAAARAHRNEFRFDVRLID
jgi:quercetin 2,3-dioxygenase